MIGVAVRAALKGGCLVDAIEVTIRGLQTGAVYALVAMGLALIFSTSKMLNFAHGEMFVVGPVVSWLLWQERDVPLGFALVVALVATAVLAGVEERFVVRPTTRHGAIGWVLSTLGVASVLAWAAERILDNEPQTISFYFAGTSKEYGDLTIDLYRTALIAVAIAIGIALSLFLRRTFTGMAILALSENRDGASLRGVNVSRLLTVAFIVGSLLATVAGFAMAPYTFAEAHAGLPYVLKGFVAAVLGGLTGERIVHGALAGGFLLGVVEQWGVELVGLDYRDTLVVVLLLVVMFLRPQGIFGIRERTV